MQSAVFAIVRNPVHAESVVDELLLAGFATKNVSVLYSDIGGVRGFSHVKSSKAPEGAVVGAEAGGMMGGLAGLLMGMGTLTIPGAGFFIAAGPVLTALSGVTIGATAGGVSGALIGLGFPEYEAKLYAASFQEGGTLVAVHTENNQEIKKAREIFDRAEAQEIGVTHEAEILSPAAHNLPI